MSGLLLLLALCLPACDDGGGGWVIPDTWTDTDGGADTSTDSVWDTAGDPPSDTLLDPLEDPPADDGSSDPDVITIPLCMETCTSPADCGTPSSPAYDSDNYSCTGNYCVYTGCVSDFECTTALGSGYGCDGSTSPPYCAETCASYADCGYPTLPAYTPDHYTCPSGYCVYAGCRSDTECSSTVGAGYGCNTSYPSAVCMETCGTGTDCGQPTQPAYDSDNYACTGGYCVYTGCLSDAECVSTLGAGYGCMGL